MNEVHAADGNNKTLWLNKFLPHQNPYSLGPRQGESSWVEMSVSFARRLPCFRVKIKDLQTAELAYVKKDLYEVVGCQIVGSLILWTMHGTSI